MKEFFKFLCTCELNTLYITPESPWLCVCKSTKSCVICDALSHSRHNAADRSTKVGHAIKFELILMKTMKVITTIMEAYP